MRWQEMHGCFRGAGRFVIGNSGLEVAYLRQDRAGGPVSELARGFGPVDNPLPLIHDRASADVPKTTMSFLDELQRRNVFRVAALYVVTSWLILQVADVLLPNLGTPEWAFALVLGLLILGFPVVLVFSWVFELTPEGLKREAEVESTHSVAAETGRKIDKLTIAMLALAIVVVIVDRLIPESGPVPQPDVAAPVIEDAVSSRPGAPAEGRAAPERTIAVLPFADMSPDKDQAYLSDGLAEELLNLLARIPELRVASRTSAFSFKGKDVTIADVAGELNVAHVLEGSVRKSGDRVRITAQLIDAGQDVHLWSESWDRTLDDVFAIQDEIAAAVVRALKVTLLGEAPTVPATDPTAYTLFLQGLHLGGRGSPDSLRQAVSLHRQALEIDPEYVPAWLGLAVAYSNMASSRMMPSAEAYPEVLAASSRALAIDPDNADAHALLGWVRQHFEGDYAGAARQYQRALELELNNVRALNGLAVLIHSLGHSDRAVRLWRKLIERDPINASAVYNTGFALAMSGDLDAARVQLDRALALSPDMTIANIWRAIVDFLNEDYSSSLERFDKLSENTGRDVYRMAGEALVFPFLDRDQEAAAALARLEAEHAQPLAYIIATIHAWHGRTDAAFEWLEKAYEFQGRSGLIYARVDPRLAPLHDDPRWQPLLEKAGLSDAQVAAIPLPDLPSR